jgi:hypothetical protein
MWLGYPNTISIIGDFETMCGKSCNNCPSLFYVIHVLTLYIHSPFCVTVSVMNPGHVAYLHYAVTTVWAFCSDHLLLIALGRRGCQ